MAVLNISTFKHTLNGKSLKRSKFWNNYSAICWNSPLSWLHISNLMWGLGFTTPKAKPIKLEHTQVLSDCLPYQTPLHTPLMPPRTKNRDQGRLAGPSKGRPSQPLDSGQDIYCVGKAGFAGLTKLIKREVGLILFKGKQSRLVKIVFNMTQSAGNYYYFLHRAIYCFLSPFCPSNPKRLIRGQPRITSLLASYDPLCGLRVLSFGGAWRSPLKKGQVIVGSSETIRTTTTNTAPIDFLDWLAGLIDGDGCFLVSKAGYTSCEISLHEKEVQVLYKISAYFGGSVSKRTRVKSFRWRLHKKAGMLYLTESLKGRMHHPTRLSQFAKVITALHSCSVVSNLTAPLKELDIISQVALRATPHNMLACDAIKSISLNNAWISGFFDADGTVNCNQTTHQLSFSISQKDRYLLDSIKTAFNVGYVYEDSASNCYIYYVTSLDDLAVIFNYFNDYPSQIPIKKAEFTTLRRLWFFKKEGYHLRNHPLNYSFLNLAKMLKGR
jgi:LAGLIDADG endonuclease